MRPESPLSSEEIASARVILRDSIRQILTHLDPNYSERREKRLSESPIIYTSFPPDVAVHPKYIVRDSNSSINVSENPYTSEERRINIIDVLGISFDGPNDDEHSILEKDIKVSLENTTAAVEGSRALLRRFADTIGASNSTE